MRPKVSVVIPVWGVEKYIERCVRSLFEQTLTEVEYIFVDDCSPDKSIKILQEVLEEYPNRKEQVRIIRLENNSGQAVGRAVGMKVAKGEYIISCDSDDWLEIDAYERMYTIAKENDVDMVTCDVHVYEHDKEYIWTHGKYVHPRDMLTCRKMITLWSMCDKLIKREIIHDNNIYALPGINMWEDVTTSMESVFFSKSIIQIHQALYNYDRTRNDSTSCGEFYSIPKIIDMWKCIQHVSDTFNTNGFDWGETAYIYKRYIKDMLLRHNPTPYELWRQVFPEVGKYVLKKGDDSITYRVCYYLMNTGISLPYMLLLKFFRLRVSLKKALQMHSK